LEMISLDWFLQLGQTQLVKNLSGFEVHNSYSVDPNFINQEGEHQPK
jgi:hypothetical protein